jgi:hypothetical protein
VHWGILLLTAGQLCIIDVDWLLNKQLQFLASHTVQPVKQFLTTWSLGSRHLLVCFGPCSTDCSFNPTAFISPPTGPGVLSSYLIVGRAVWGSSTLCTHSYPDSFVIENLNQLVLSCAADKLLQPFGPKQQ